jgi:hypothetical protein
MTASAVVDPPPLARFALLGLVAWAFATGAIRMAPLRSLRLGPPEATLAVMAALGAVIALALLLLRDVAPYQRVPVMCAFVLPGMIGDSLTTAFCADVFPNLPNGSGSVFGGLMLAGYAVLLAVSIALGGDRQMSA